MDWIPVFVDTRDLFSRIVCGTSSLGHKDRPEMSEMCLGLSLTCEIWGLRRPDLPCLDAHSASLLDPWRRKQSVPSERATLCPCDRALHYRRPRGRLQHHNILSCSQFISFSTSDMLHWTGRSGIETSCWIVLQCCSVHCVRLWIMLVSVTCVCLSVCLTASWRRSTFKHLFGVF
jgi:hypothetical protein